MTVSQSWFVPVDVLMITCSILVTILATLFLFTIILDKTCHTIPMMLVGNSCLVTLAGGSSLLDLGIFALQNDLRQIYFQDLLCIFRAYILNALAAIMYYSYLLQAFYRYVTVVYPNRLFYQTVKFQVSIIFITWILGFVYPIPYLLTDEIIYNFDNQICQLPIRLSFSIVYAGFSNYFIPVSLSMFIYWKLVRYVKEMSKRVTATKTLLQATRELRIVRHIIILLTILITVCFPLVIFILISFFTSPPKYHYRIAYLFIDASLIFVMITLFHFTEPLKTSIMKRIQH